MELSKDRKHQMNDSKNEMTDAMLRTSFFLSHGIEVAFSLSATEDRAFETLTFTVVDNGNHRIANVPPYERAIMAANDLADAVEAMDRFSGRADPIADVVKACAAFREATK
jgi:hypothetical protein